MAIKRLTIELDDSPDVATSTALPDSLIGSKQALPPAITNTGTPDQQDDYQEQVMLGSDKGQKSAQVAEPIGRTPSDLIFAFINRPEFTIVALTFLSFLIFINKLKSFDNFKLPIGLSVLLNILWFGTLIVRRFAIWNKKKPYGSDDGETM